MMQTSGSVQTSSKSGPWRKVCLCCVVSNKFHIFLTGLYITVDQDCCTCAIECWSSLHNYELLWLLNVLWKTVLIFGIQMLSLLSAVTAEHSKESIMTFLSETEAIHSDLNFKHSLFTTKCEGSAYTLVGPICWMLTRTNHHIIRV